MRMEEKILKELDAINQQLKGINQNFQKIDQRFEETEERIITTLREELDQRIHQSTTEISNEIKDLCYFIENREHEIQDKMREELRQHENKALRGVEAFRKVFVS